MFEIPADQTTGTPARQHYSFEETAAEIGCGVGDLRREIDKVRHRVLDPAGVTVAGPPLTGFRAINVEDYERLLVECKAEGALSAPDGFPGIVRYDQLQGALGVSGIALQELLDRLRIREQHIDCLTAAGHGYALAKLKWLAAETPPAGLTGIDVTLWRDARRHERENAEVAKSNEASGRPPQPVRRRERPRAAVAENPA